MMRHIPRVLFINPWDRLTGPNQYLAEILRHLPAWAEQATVVAHEETDALEEYRKLGCQTLVWPEMAPLHPHLIFRRLTSLLKAHTAGLAQVAARMHALRPDAVVSNSEIVCLAGMAARLNGVPHLQVFHSLLFQYRWQRLRQTIRFYLRWLALFSRRFIAVSETVKSMLVEYLVEPDHVRVIPNGFDIAHIRNRSRLPLPEDVAGYIGGRFPVLLSIGRLAPMKGQNVLIDALPRVRRSYPKVVCLLVGRKAAEESVEKVDHYYASLLERIRNHRLEDCVCLPGETDAVPQLLHHANLYIHPSLTESFSRAVVEALICGRPVVCSNAGALPETVAGEGAILVPPGRPDALADAVLRFLGEESLREKIVAFGRRQAEERFSIQQTAHKLLEVIASVQEQQRGQ